MPPSPPPQKKASRVQRQAEECLVEGKPKRNLALFVLAGALGLLLLRGLVGVEMELGWGEKGRLHSFLFCSWQSIQPA